jgi:glycosyltransferase involved in cell wall biosynthesis
VFTGYVPDVRQVYWMSDLFTLTSNRVETFSIAALEAMSCGLPAVITNIGGATEMVFDGENGFLSGTDAESIASTWSKALDHTFSAKDIRAIVREKFDQERMTMEYKQAMGVQPMNGRVGHFIKQAENKWGSADGVGPNQMNWPETTKSN